MQNKIFACTIHPGGGGGGGGVVCVTMLDGRGWTSSFSLIFYWSSEHHSELHPKEGM